MDTPLELEPRLRMGPFVFGSTLPVELASELVRLPADGVHDMSETWGVDDGESNFSISTENGIVTSIHVEVSCLFRGVEMIGLPVEAAVGLFKGEAPVVEHEWALNQPYDIITFDGSCVMMCVFSGRVRSVDAWLPDEDH